MKPVEFREQDCVYAKDQCEYLPLPARRLGGGTVVWSCWGLGWRERLRLVLTGRVWLAVLANGQPLQPVRMQVEKPDFDESA